MHALYEVQGVSESVALEERSADLREAKPDETLRKKCQFFCSAVSLWLRL